MTTILVTGATGLLGSALLDRLDGAAELRALSRRAHDADPRATWYASDLHTGAGLARALDGVDVVVHCASEPDVPGADVETTRTLVDAAEAAGVAHFVFVSIVGIDEIPMQYYKDKRCCERMVRESEVPSTTLRATQFHQFIPRLVDRFADLPTPVVVVPRGTCQPVDVDEVAARIAELALGEPAGRVADMGGPQVLSIAELARAELRARGAKRPVVSSWMPGKLGAAYAAGCLTTPENACGGRTWGEYVGAKSDLGSGHAR